MRTTTILLSVFVAITAMIAIGLIVQRLYREGHTYHAIYFEKKLGFGGRYQDGTKLIFDSAVFPPGESQMPIEDRCPFVVEYEGARYSVSDITVELLTSWGAKQSPYSLGMLAYDVNFEGSKFRMNCMTKDGQVTMIGFSAEVKPMLSQIDNPHRVRVFIDKGATIELPATREEVEQEYGPPSRWETKRLPL